MYNQLNYDYSDWDQKFVLCFMCDESIGNSKLTGELVRPINNTLVKLCSEKCKKQFNQSFNDKSESQDILPKVEEPKTPESQKILESSPQDHPLERMTKQYGSHITGSFITKRRLPPGSFEMQGKFKKLI